MKLTFEHGAQDAAPEHIRMRYLIILLVAGCSSTPYVGYTHLDATPFNNDGEAYDLVCGGIKTEYARIAACNNVNDGQGMVKIDLEWSLSE